MATAARGMFPIEILENIISHLDGKTLLGLRSVSSVWKQMIDDFMTRFDNKRWQRHCFETIPTNTLIDYLEVEVPAMPIALGEKYFEKDPNGKFDFTKFNWEMVFRNHQVMRNGENWVYAKNGLINIDLENDPVSCVKVTGNLMITGHFSGLMCLWSLDEGEMIDVYQNAHSNRVTEIVFGNVYEKEEYVLSINVDANLEFVANHHFLISASFSGRVQARGLALSEESPETGDLENVNEIMMLAEHRNPHVYVSLLNRVLAIFCRDNSINLWNITVPDHFPRNPGKLPRFIPKCSLRGPDSCPLFVGTLCQNKFFFDERKIMLMTRLGKSRNMFDKSPFTWRPTRGRDQEMTLVMPRSLDAKAPTRPLHENYFDSLGGNISISEDFKSLRIDLDNSREQEDEQEICKNVYINYGDSSRSQSVKMVSLPRKKLLECFGITAETGRIDMATHVLWAKIFHDDLFVILTKKNQLLISIDGNNFSACEPFNDLEKGHVTSVTYFANVFAIGFATGQVWIFFVKGPLDFHYLDFNLPNVTLKAGDDPITSLDLGLGLSKEETVLVCSSEKNAYVFRI